MDVRHSRFLRRKPLTTTAAPTLEWRPPPDAMGAVVVKFR
jgi:hypothetical protein